MKKIFIFLLSLSFPLAVAYIGSLFTTPFIDSWYQTLNKPTFNPPNWLFSPVWTLLFILMGIALFLVWQSKKQVSKKKAIITFFVQLFLNLLWSFLFFFLKRPGLAFIEIIILVFFIIATILYFKRISKTASYLLIPYLVWVLFASVLNFYIWQLN